MKLQNLEKMVRQVLKTEPETRGSDDALYISIIKKMGCDLGGISALDYFRTYRKRKLPTIESVGRCRRRIQEHNEALKPIEKVEVMRRENEKTFYNYSLGF